MGKTDWKVLSMPSRMPLLTFVLVIAEHAKQWSKNCCKMLKLSEHQKCKDSGKCTLAIHSHTLIFFVFVFGGTYRCYSFGNAMLCYYPIWHWQ
jgi:hypothetical protein